MHHLLLPSSPLARLLTEGYRSVLPEAQFVDFDQTTPDSARTMMNGLSPGDLVILIQSTSFRLNEFRFRLELFNRSLAVIEHPHLGRNIIGILMGDKFIGFAQMSVFRLANKDSKSIFPSNEQAII